MDAYLASKLPHVISVAAYQGHNAVSGAPAWGTPAAAAAMQVTKRRMFELAPGTKVVTSVQVTTPLQVHEQDRVWLHGVSTSTGTAKKPIAVEHYFDELGAFSHTIIYL